MSPSSRNVGSPANASFQCRTFGFADLDHLLRVRAGQLTPAGETAAAADLREILKLAHCPTCSSLPSRLYLDHSHCPVLAPATLAALPSTRAIPDRCVFYVVHPISLHSCVGYLST